MATALLAAPLCSALAQDQESQPVLPDLAPREVEIRGQLQIAFPSLQRQPLVGFNPPPRVPEISLSRRPIIEDYADAGASFRRALLDPPEPPGVTALTGEGPLTAEVEVSAGRYVSRHIHAVGVARPGSGQAIDFQLLYSGTDGEVMSSTPDEIRNRGDALSGSLIYRRQIASTTLGAGLRGFAGGYSLYGIDTTGTNGRILPNPDRTTRSATESIWIASAAGQPVGYRLEGSLTQTKIESDLFARQTIADPATERVERRGSLSGNIEFPVSDVTAFLTGNVGSAGLDSDGFVGSEIRHAEVAAGVKYATPVLTFEGAPGILTASFDSVVGGGEGGRKSATYLSPRFNFRLRTGERVVFYARNDPHVQANSLGTLFTANPYLVNEPRMQPSIHTIDAESGIALFSGPVQIKAEARVQRSPNWSYFVVSKGSGASSVAGGFFDLGFGDGQIISLGGEMSLSLPAQLQLSAAAYYHTSELTDLDVRIPNQPQLSGRAGLSYPFATNRGLVQVTGRFLGSRYADIAESIALDAYLDLDLYARYNVNRSIGLILRIDNIGPTDNKLWSGYEESSFIVSGGVRVLW